MNTKLDLTLVMNQKAWEKYKASLYYASDVGINHSGDPDRFPCYVHTTSRDVNYNTCYINYTHQFLYPDDLRNMIEKILESPG